MKIILVSKCSLDIEQYVEFKMSVLISPSKSLISLCWVTYSIENWAKNQENMEKIGQNQKKKIVKEKER